MWWWFYLIWKAKNANWSASIQASTKLARKQSDCWNTFILFSWICIIARGWQFTWHGRYHSPMNMNQFLQMGLVPLGQAGFTSHNVPSKCSPASEFHADQGRWPQVARIFSVTNDQQQRLNIRNCCGGYLSQKVINHWFNTNRRLANMLIQPCLRGHHRSLPNQNCHGQERLLPVQLRLLRARESRDGWRGFLLLACHHMLSVAQVLSLPKDSINTTSLIQLKP